MIWPLLGLAVTVIMGFCGDRIAGFFTVIHRAVWRD